jgi:hypothetical protein
MLALCALLLQLSVCAPLPAAASIARRSRPFVIAFRALAPAFAASLARPLPLPSMPSTVRPPPLPSSASPAFPARPSLPPIVLPSRRAFSLACGAGAQPLSASVSWPHRARMESVRERLWRPAAHSQTSTWTCWAHEAGRCSPHAGGHVAGQLGRGCELSRWKQVSHSVRLAQLGLAQELYATGGVARLESETSMGGRGIGKSSC